MTKYTTIPFDLEYYKKHKSEVKVVTCSGYPVTIYDTTLTGGKPIVGCVKHGETVEAVLWRKDGTYDGWTDWSLKLLVPPEKPDMLIFDSDFDDVRITFNASCNGNNGMYKSAFVMICDNLTDSELYTHLSDDNICDVYKWCKSYLEYVGVDCE